MNRKDFDLVARTIKQYSPHLPNALARAFADAIEKADGCSGFDRAKFLKRCGV